MPQASGFRSVLENVTKMAAATAAMDLGTRCKEGVVRLGPHSVWKALPKARPASFTVVLVLRRIGRKIAALAMVGARAFLLI